MLFRQDIITKKNAGKNRRQKVIEVGWDIVKYKKFSNQSGLTYVIRQIRHSWHLIRKTGTRDVFSSEEPFGSGSTGIQKRTNICFTNNLRAKRKNRILGCSGLTVPVLHGHKEN